MRITLPYLILNLILVIINAQVGVALALATWEEQYLYLGLMSLTFWGITYLFQVRLLVRYLTQYKEALKKEQLESPNTSNL